METLEELFNNLSNYYNEEAIQTDYNNNNFDLENWESFIDEYYMPNIVMNSVINGQITQAREQFDRYGISITDIKDSLTNSNLISMGL